MQISNNFMDVFFGYNGRVGDVKGKSLANDT